MRDNAQRYNEVLCDINYNRPEPKAYFSDVIFRRKGREACKWGMENRRGGLQCSRATCG